jgi:hypothetical protein
MCWRIDPTTSYELKCRIWGIQEALRTQDFWDLMGSKIPGGSSNTQRNNTWLAVPPASQDTPSGAGTAIDQQKTQHAARSPILKQALLGQMLHLLAFPAAGEPRLAALRQTLSLPHG